MDGWMRERKNQTDSQEDRLCTPSYSYSLSNNHDHDIKMEYWYLDYSDKNAA
jgi:hypothetical protein